MPSYKPYEEQSSKNDIGNCNKYHGIHVLDNADLYITMNHHQHLNYNQEIDLDACSISSRHGKV